MKKQKLGPHQKQWIAALRSGRYKQRKQKLGNMKKNCCLGVGCRIARIKMGKKRGAFVWGEDREVDDAPFELVDWLGLNDEAGIILYDDNFNSLIDMNDGHSETFLSIADFCESNPEKVFKETK